MLLEFFKLNTTLITIFWPGLWEAKEELRNGFRWVLGDENEIGVCSDPWLRSKNNFLVEDIDYGLIGNPKACHLFKTGLLEFDEEKVREVFDEVDAKKILNTKIPQHAPNDQVAWRLLRKGYIL